MRKEDPLCDSGIGFPSPKWQPFAIPKGKQPARIYSPSRKGFLDLPGEIRNQIYRNALTQHAAIDGRRTKFPAIALLRVNKKVHEEASSILYSENTFTFGISIKFADLHRMGLHCFPFGFEAWPTPLYHDWLHRLHIGISFTPGNIMDFEATNWIIDDLKAMRRAYDEAWSNLDITYDFCEGTTHDLTFTMAWLKARCFEHIAHPTCKVITKSNVPQIVRWCLERTLHGRDPVEQLHQEQKLAFHEARRIAQDSYASGMRRSRTDLSWRLVWGCRIDVTNPHWGSGQILPHRCRIYDQRHVYGLVHNAMRDQQCIDILLEDNEWRVLAALEMPQEKDLLIDKCAELRVYFALQEMAAKLVALEVSLM